MESLSEQKVRIAIAGGGIAGLALAIGLSDIPHLDVTVYEATKEYREVGQGLAMHANAIGAMKSIDPQVFQAWRDSSTLEGSPDDADSISVTTVRWAWGPHAGETYAELGSAKARKTVSRADLLNEFLKTLQQRGGKVRLGKRLSGIRDHGDGVTISFDDGSEIEADCLMGVEGSRSKTREFLLGADHPATPSKNDNRYFSFRTLIPMDEVRPHIDEFWTRNVSIRTGPKGTCLSMPVKQGTVLQIGRVFMAPEDQDLYTYEVPDEAFDDYDEEFRKVREIAANYPQSSRIYYWDHDPAPTYFRNRVCMMGDAAHCTTPFAGNGAAQALEDAATLKALFQKLESPYQLPALFQAFDQVRRPRSQKVVAISRKWGHIYLMLDKISHDLEATRKLIAEEAAYMNNFDIEAQNEEAVKVFEATKSK